MKYPITVFLVLMTLIGEAQVIKIGDNLKAEYSKIKKPYFFKAPPFTDWREGTKMFFVGDKPSPNDCAFLFIALEDTTLIGVFTMKEPSVFMVDTEGNSVLNSTSEFFFLPLWTVKNRTRVISSDKTILSLLDKMYEKTLQANELEMDEKTINEYQQYKTDTALSNRHIALLFDNYQNIVAETAAKHKKAPGEICVPLMESLLKECVSLYKTIPAIVCIYMGEAFQNAGMIDKAREHFKMSLKLYPSSIPLLVYTYQHEQDTERKKEQLTALKKKYHKHWMVKDL